MIGTDLVLTKTLPDVFVEPSIGNAMKGIDSEIKIVIEFLRMKKQSLE